MTAKAKNSELKRQVREVLLACQEKKAEGMTVLNLDKEHGGFTDYFVICSGTNPRQIQAISDEIERRLSLSGSRPAHVEGYKQAEWVLLDYVDFVVHVFSERARQFYDLERLWKSAKRLEPADLEPGSPRRRTAGTRNGAATKAPAKRVRKTPPRAKRDSQPESG
jgi:ribosome-associated protein